MKALTSLLLVAVLIQLRTDTHAFDFPQDRRDDERASQLQRDFIGGIKYVTRLLIELDETDAIKDRYKLARRDIDSAMRKRLMTVIIYHEYYRSSDPSTVKKAFEWMGDLYFDIANDVTNARTNIKQDARNDESQKEANKLMAKCFVLETTAMETSEILSDLEIYMQKFM